MNGFVHYDPDGHVLHVGRTAVSDTELIIEASRWISGSRGEPVRSRQQLAAADLEPFAREAFLVGARVLMHATESNEITAVNEVVKNAGDRAANAADEVARRTDEVVQRATERLRETSAEATNQIMGRVTALLGGDHPELLARLAPTLDRVGTSLESKISDVVAAAVSGFAEDTEKRYRELGDLIRDVRQEVAVAHASTVAAGEVKSRTTEKGHDYEAVLHEKLQEIAVSMGIDYTDTSKMAGLLERNKKGDGVFRVGSGSTRIVIEAHDGSSKDWGPYLAEAERNRGAVASIGFIRNVSDNNDCLIRVLGPRRIVVAYDPVDDSLDLTRTVVQLMSATAMSSDGRLGVEEANVAQEHISVALEHLVEIDQVTKSANAIQGHIDSINRHSDRLMKNVKRELTTAQNALEGVGGQSSAETTDAAQ